MSDVELPPPPRTDLKVHLTPEQVASFHEQGFLAVGRITSDAELEWLAEIYDRLFEAHQSGVPGGYFDLSRPYDSDGPDLLPQVLRPELLHPELYQATYFRNARRIAAQLLGTDEAALEGWGHLIQKPARIGGELPWHQDEAYWDPRLEYSAVGVWMPLDPATLESGCMEFIPGSHRGEVLPHRHIGDDPAVHGLVSDGVDASGAVSVPVAPGSATVHHCRTLHHSRPNTTGRVRRACATEFQLEPRRRARPAERPWVRETARAWRKRGAIVEPEAGG